MKSAASMPTADDARQVSGPVMGAPAAGAPTFANGKQHSAPGTSIPAGSSNGSADNGRRISTQDIQLVQNLIERCLQLYMPQSEVVTTLQEQAKIEPGFTNLVWQKLEEQNPEFFKAYYIRLKVKDQVVMFNYLLEQQISMVQKLHMSWLQTLPGMIPRPGMPPGMPPMPPGMMPGGFGMPMGPMGPMMMPPAPPMAPAPAAAAAQQPAQAAPTAAPAPLQQQENTAASNGPEIQPPQQPLVHDLLDVALRDVDNDIHLMNSTTDELIESLAGLTGPSDAHGGPDGAHGLSLPLGLDLNPNDVPLENLPKSFSFSDFGGFGGFDLNHLGANDGGMGGLDMGSNPNLHEFDTSGGISGMPRNFSLSDMAPLDFDALDKDA